MLLPEAFIFFRSLSPNFCLNLILNSFSSFCSFLRTMFSQIFSDVLCLFVVVYHSGFVLVILMKGPSLYLLITCLCLNPKVILNSYLTILTNCFSSLPHLSIWISWLGILKYIHHLRLYGFILNVIIWHFSHFSSFIQKLVKHR